MEPSAAACRLDCTYPRFTPLPPSWPHAPIAPAANNRSLLVYCVVIQTSTTPPALGWCYKEKSNLKVPGKKIGKHFKRVSQYLFVDTHQGSPGREAAVYTRWCKTFECGPVLRCPEERNTCHPDWGHPSRTLYHANLEMQDRGISLRLVSNGDSNDTLQH